MHTTSSRGPICQAFTDTPKSRFISAKARERSGRLRSETNLMKSLLRPNESRAANTRKSGTSGATVFSKAIFMDTASSAFSAIRVLSGSVTKRSRRYPGIRAPCTEGLYGAADTSSPASMP